MTQAELNALYAAIPQVAGNGAAAENFRAMLTSLLYAVQMAQPAATHRECATMPVEERCAACRWAAQLAQPEPKP